MNLYRYVGNDATGATDPSGLVEDDDGFDKYRKSGYRENYFDETPDCPRNWRVHHTKQQALRERYRRAGINVDNPKYLRGVPNEIHKEITNSQLAWAADLRSKNGWTRSEFWEKVPLKEVREFEARLEKEFRDLWVPPGKNQAEKVRGIRSKVSNSAWLAKFTMERGSRLKRLGLAMAGVAILSMFDDQKLWAACEAMTFDPETDKEFQNLLYKYQTALDEITYRRSLSHNTADHLRQAWYTFFKKFTTDESQSSLDALNSLIGATIDAKLVGD